MKLTKNFDLTEFKVSADYPELAAIMNIEEYQIDRLRLLCESCLQPIRDLFGTIKIISGYRNHALNDKIGGSKTSDHLDACAADFVPLKSDMKTVLNFCKTLPYRQLIYYPKKNFIHISINIPGKQYKHEFLLKEE